MKQAMEDDARTRLLKAAVALFGEKGVDNVSLRELTAHANVNIAGVNYYFGTKAELEEAVFDAVAEQVNARRISELDAVLADARARHARPDAARILDTFVRPYLEPEPEAEGALLAQLVLKHRLAPTPMTRRLVQRHFDTLGRRYIDAFTLAFPKVDPAEFEWRYIFMASAVVLMATDRRQSNRIASISGGRFDATDTPALKAALLRFLVGGLKAPAA